MCTRVLTGEEEKSKAANWTSYGSWDFIKLSQILPTEILQKLISMLPPQKRVGYDIMTWGASTNGNFTIKSACSLIEKCPEQLYDPLYKWILRWKGAERIRVFILKGLKLAWIWDSKKCY